MPSTLPLPLPSSISVPPPRLDFHQLRQQLAAVRDGSLRIHSTNELDLFLLNPFRKCISTHQLQGLENEHKHHDLKAVSEFVLAAQEAFLSKLVIDWHKELNNQAVYQLVFFAIDTDPSLAKTLENKQLSEQNADQPHQSSLSSRDQIAPHFAGIVHLTTLRVLSAFLTSYQDPRIGPSLIEADLSADDTTRQSTHPASADAILSICSLVQDHLSLPCIVKSLSLENNLARREIALKEVTRLLISIPARLSNFTRGNIPQGLKVQEWYARVIVKQLAHLTHSSLDSDAQPHRQPSDEVASELISRLEKTGYINSTLQYDMSSQVDLGFWPALFRIAIPFLSNPSSQLALQSDFSASWPRMEPLLPHSLRKRVHSSLLGALDSLIQRRQMGLLVANDERGKPAKEPSLFFSTQTHSLVAACTWLLDQYMFSFYQPTKHSSSVQVAAQDSDSDDEGAVPDQASQMSEAWCDLAIPLARDGSTVLTHFCPLLGWILAFWIHQVQEKLNNQTKSYNLVQQCTNKVISAWGDARRVRITSLEEEQYLTTLLICLVACQSPASTSMDRLSRSADLLNGVSCHLEHTDPLVRRLGMVVAEILSAKSHNPNSGGKPLNFGSSIWSGNGEGREEARVLRALHDTWQVQSQAIHKCASQLATQPNLLLQTLDLKLGKVNSYQVSSVNQVVKPTRDKPVSRRLPALQPAPRKGGRTPLILPLSPGSSTLIESVSDQESSPTDVKASLSSNPLKMFQAEHRKTRPVDLDGSSSAASSSSDDENSSDDEREKGNQDDMTRIAADLAGLDHNQANSLFKQSGFQLPSSAALNATKPANEFDRDKEAHAPDFAKKKASRPPVYINQLAPLLRSNERAEIKMGLKFANGLIRHKTRWGSEVDENAVDLVYALCGLQNNFSIKKFEERRTDALTALVVASPRLAAGCITEQFFHHQYSMAQRLSMLNALAFSARELSGNNQPMVKSDQVDPSRRSPLERLATGLADSAISKAKQEGEDQVPLIQREKKLTFVGSSSSSLRFPSRHHHHHPLIQPIDSSISISPFTPNRPQDRYIDLAGPVFLLPLLRRFDGYFSDYLVRLSRRSNSNSSTYLGTGISGLFSSSLLSSFFSTISILISFSSTSVFFQTEISLDILQLCSTLFNNIDLDSNVISPLLSCLLLVLEIHHQMDESRFLLDSKKNQILLLRLKSFVLNVFKVYDDHQGGGSEIKNHSHFQVARLSAAILIRFHQLTTQVETMSF